MKLLGLLVVFFLCAAPVFGARSISISSDKTSLFGDEDFHITASASGFAEGETIYIKGALFQEGSTNYFGYTKKDDAWVKNGETTLGQRSVKIGEWDGDVVARSDFGDSGYKGEGNYQFKLGFYYLTSGGNVSSVNWSTNSLTLAISEPDPTPTPTASPAPTPTPTRTPTPTPAPTPTKTPTPTVGKTGMPTPTRKSLPTPAKENSFDTPDTIEASDASPLAEPLVLGEQATSAASPQNKSVKPLIVSMLLVSSGLGLLAFYFVWQKRDAGKKTDILTP